MKDISSNKLENKKVLKRKAILEAAEIVKLYNISSKIIIEKLGFEQVDILYDGDMCKLNY